MYLQKFFGIIKDGIWNYNFIVTLVKVELCTKNIKFLKTLTNNVQKYHCQQQRI